jgi:hypothetical protein
MVAADIDTRRCGGSQPDSEVSECEACGAKALADSGRLDKARAHEIYSRKAHSCQAEARAAGLDGSRAGGV